MILVIFQIRIFYNPMHLKCIYVGINGNSHRYEMMLTTSAICYNKIGNKFSKISPKLDFLLGFINSLGATRRVKK